MDSLITPSRKELNTKPWALYTLTTLGTANLEKMNEAMLYVKMLLKKGRSISQASAMNDVRNLA